MSNAVRAATRASGEPSYASATTGVPAPRPGWSGAATATAHGAPLRGLASRCDPWRASMLGRISCGVEAGAAVVGGLPYRGGVTAPPWISRAGDPEFLARILVAGRAGGARRSWTASAEAESTR